MFSTLPEYCLYTTLWNLKFSSRTCYHWVVKERNSRIHFTLTVASKFDRFESSLLQCGEYCKRRGVQKYASLTWTHWNTQRLRTEWAKLDHPSSGVVDSSRSVMGVLYTFCHNIPTCCSQMGSNLTNLEAIVEVG